MNNAAFMRGAQTFGDLFNEANLVYHGQGRLTRDDLLDALAIQQLHHDVRLAMFLCWRLPAVPASDRKRQHFRVPVHEHLNGNAAATTNGKKCP